MGIKSDLVFRGLKYHAVFSWGNYEASIWVQLNTGELPQELTAESSA